MSETPETLESFYALAQQHDDDAFAAATAPFFLVGPPMTEASDDWSYFTSSMVSVVDPKGSLVVDPRFEVYALHKEKSRPFADLLMVGRSTSNDVQILDTSISKLHCKFHLGATLMLSDAGSSNGTTVDGRTLPPDVPVEVEDGSVLQLGSRVFTLVDAAHFRSVVLKVDKVMRGREP